MNLSYEVENIEFLEKKVRIFLKPEFRSSDYVDVLTVTRKQFEAFNTGVVKLEKGVSLQLNLGIKVEPDWTKVRPITVAQRNE